jgi:hypothetical protein
MPKPIKPPKKTTLPTPVVLTTTITEMVITSFDQNYEKGTLDVHYISLRDDGSQHNRGHIKMYDEDDIELLFADVQTL